MAVLHDDNLMSIIFKLMDRGLSSDDIDRAMRQMIGNDWKDVDASTWLRRLRSQGFVLHNDSELTVNDLEALVKGRIKIEDFNKRDRRRI